MINNNTNSSVCSANQFFAEGKFFEAFTIYKIEAENNNASCQRRIGFMYYQGKGVQCDLFEAEAWLMRAFINGDKQASVGLFRLYVEREEYAQALIYMRKMARKKYPPALYWLGIMYYKGYGVPKNLKKELIYFTLASRYGHFSATRDRAKLLMGGRSGFFSRFIGIYEFAKILFIVLNALRKNLNDERQFY